VGFIVFCLVVLLVIWVVCHIDSRWQPEDTT
jgi:hypothetical protein